MKPGYLSDALPLRPGDVISGKYRVEELIAFGGMGIVYAATHCDLGQRVALKVLRPELAHEPEALLRFGNEARAAARLRSQHVARVLDIAPLPSGSPYVVMEYLDGSDLCAVAQRHGPLPVEVAVDYVLQACEAVAEAHAAGIVHRDLKPANLFLTSAPDGSALIKVLDFGISKGLKVVGRALTHPTHALGSPHYMSPEQMQSARRVDGRADIWSLGVVLYELLTGQCPFDAETLPSIFAKVQKETPAPPSAIRPEIPAALEQAVLRCLEKDRDARFGSVAELIAALEPFAPASGLSGALRAQRASVPEPAFELVRNADKAARESRAEWADNEVVKSGVQRRISLSEIPGFRPTRAGRFAFLFAAAAVVALGVWRGPEIAQTASQLAASPEAQSAWAWADRTLASATLSVLGD